jgi:hypothetical protein
MYSMTQNFFLFLFWHENPKYAEFYVENKSVEIIVKKCNQTKLFAKNFGKVLVQKRTNSNIANFLPYNFFDMTFFAFFSTVLIPAQNYALF